jgi:hypothetical protein
MQCCDHFTKVLLVGGNHEYYGTSYEKGLQLVEEITNDPATKGKVLYLHRMTYDVPNSNITIAGCTLHSHRGVHNQVRQVRTPTLALLVRSSQLPCLFAKRESLIALFDCLVR